VLLLIVVHSAFLYIILLVLASVIQYAALLRSLFRLPVRLTVYGRPLSVASMLYFANVLFIIGHRRCAYYIFRRWFFFLSVAFPARPYIRLPQPVPISKGRRGGCYLKYDPFENSSHVGR